MTRRGHEKGLVLLGLTDERWEHASDGQSRLRVARPSTSTHKMSEFSKETWTSVI